MQLSTDSMLFFRKYGNNQTLVLAETGITFLPESYIHLYSEQTDLISYPLADNLEGKWTIAIALPQETSMSRSSKEFIEVILSSAY